MSAGGFAYDFIARGIQRIRQRRKAKRAQKRQPLDETAEDFNVQTDEGSMKLFPHGSQTLTGIAVLVLTPWLAKYGLEGQAEAIIAAAGTLIGAVVAVLGYLRRKKLPAE